MEFKIENISQKVEQGNNTKVKGEKKKENKRLNPGDS